MALFMYEVSLKLKRMSAVSEVLDHFRFQTELLPDEKLLEVFLKEIRRPHKEDIQVVQAGVTELRTAR